ncbi:MULTISPECIES: YafY family protein [unclassified Streptomyces]|uniref:helix-turn-helix transcriptional regulator n=1 Tax=unclassified Streptomyces TaxID=2593676 RepID=UPI0006FCBD89|nr:MULTISPECIES: YafY family protein [unclassified Streptomyces]KQX50941.1 transcriptional regulator [Streptomyces sp. Root1304]KRA85107.1 transcriptional regulator [Streptomyces sp. Root66D1]
MKSSRLVSILLLLQTRGRMTADGLAEELGVSVRTVYRDVEALHAAGVPLYGEAGHRGGYRLLPGHRSRLTGLFAPEAEALVLAGMPGAADGLGLGPHFADAQLKLRAALPEPLREHVDRLRRRFHIDAPGWYDEGDETPFLPEVADAVRTGRVLEVRYRRWKEPTDVDRRLEPYGLVLKAGRWYLVAGPGPRTYRVDQILGLTVTDEEAGIPDGFDLAAHWRASQADFHSRLHRDEATVRISARGAARLTGAAARALAATGVPEPDGWTRATLPVESPEQAHDMLLGLGTEVEVLAPEDLRARLAATVRTLAERYA